MDISFLAQMDSALYLSTTSTPERGSFQQTSKGEPELGEESDLSAFLRDLDDIAVLDGAAICIPISSDSDASGYASVTYDHRDCPNCNN